MTYREMSDVTRIQYLRSEITVSPVVYDSATQIFSAFIATKQVSEKNEKEMMERAVKLALELALTTDRLVTQSGTKEAGI